MSVLLYRFAIGFYHLAIRLAAVFNAKAAAWVQGRRDWLGQLQAWRQAVPAEAQVLWMHCASLGEFEQGRPVLEQLRREHPDLQIVLSFYSPSGYEQRKNYPTANYVCYLPPDGPRRARQWLEVLSPDLIVFVKYEFWYFHLKSAFQRQVPVYLIAGVFRPNQLFFRWYGRAFKAVLSRFAHLYVQTDKDLSLLHAHGIENASAVGDPRVDQVIALAESEVQFPVVNSFRAGHKVLIAGSTWPPGESILLSDQEWWTADWKLIIAPHDISEGHISQIIKACQIPFVRYSSNPSEESLRSARILILDTIGMLSRVYRCGDLAYIGGGFGRSIHNTLEPAAHGLPVIFGPRHGKFFEAIRLREMGGAFVINNEEDFREVFDQLQGAEKRARAVNQVLGYLADNRGAASAIAGALSKVLGRK